MNKKAITAYFSASGITKKAAQALAEAAGTDIYEIRPETPYTSVDLDWTDKKSRSTIEMNDPAFRPPLADTSARIEDYDVVFLCFPIWWYVAPTIINTFLESYDFSGKKVVLFATSGGSGFGSTAQKLKDSCCAEIIEGRLLNGSPSKAELSAWVEGLGL